MSTRSFLARFRLITGLLFCVTWLVVNVNTASLNPLIENTLDVYNAGKHWIIESDALVQRLAESKVEPKVVEELDAIDEPSRRRSFGRWRSFGGWPSIGRRLSFGRWLSLGRRPSLDRRPFLEREPSLERQPSLNRNPIWVQKTYNSIAFQNNGNQHFMIGLGKENKRYFLVSPKGTERFRINEHISPNEWGEYSVHPIPQEVNIHWNGL